jgi:hypothetical protein
MKLTFIVNGEEVCCVPRARQSLTSMVKRALRKSRNLSRPFAEWELRDELGSLIADLSKPVESYGLAGGLYLTLKVGAGGNG